MFPGPTGASRQISPKRVQTSTGMAVETGKSFALGKVNSSANQVESEGGPAETLTHREALKLYKVTKKSRAKTSSRLSR